MFTTRLRAGRRPATLVVGVSLALFLATGCASNVPREEIIAATGANTATDSEALGGGADTATDPGVTAPGTDTGTDSAGPVTAVAPGATAAPGTGTQATNGGAATAVGNSTKAGTGAAAATTNTAACEKQGPPIVIGQSGSFSGLVGKAVGKGRIGLSVWLNDVNARGGIACHPVRLFQSDDASNPSIGASQVQDFVQNKRAIACVACFWPIDIAGPKSAAEKLNFPVVGGDSVPPEWNQSPVLFPLGGDSEAVIYGTVANAVKAGNKRVSILTCVEASACSYAKNLLIDKGLAAATGAEVAYQATISLTQTDYTAECQNSKTNKADAIFIYADSSSIQRLTRSCAGLGYVVPIIANGIAVSTDLAKDPNVTKATVFAAPGTFPWMSADNPAQQAFQAALKKYAPTLAPDGSTAIAWVSGKMFEKVIESLGPAARTQTITTEMIFKGLGNIKNETLGGLISPVTFKAGQPNAPRQPCFYAVKLDESGWTAPFGSKASCQPVSGASNSSSGAESDGKSGAASPVITAPAARLEERA
jgi:branched-chain amino acid transport system substrate-binding protein